MKIYIDIGHGEHGDPGAVSGNLIEHQMNIVVGNALAERLTAHGYAIKVEQGDLEINASAAAANAWGADYLISCHENAGGGDRGEVLYSWKNGSIVLANAVAVGLKNAGQTVVNTVRSKSNSAGTAEYFGMLRIPKMPAIIIEPCFIDNAADRQLADTVDKQKHIGVCIADAIAAVYGSTLKEDDEVEKAQAVIDGKTLVGFIKDGTSYSPTKALVEAMGGKITGWDAKTNTATISK